MTLDDIAESVGTVTEEQDDSTPNRFGTDDDVEEPSREGFEYETGW